MKRDMMLARNRTAVDEPTMRDDDDPVVVRTDEDIVEAREQPPARRGRVFAAETSETRVLDRGPWSWAGVLALGAGLMFAVMGLVGVARAGLDAPLSDPVVTVGWLQQTAWLALAHVLLGVVLASVGSAAGRDRASVLAIAGALLVVGLVLMIEPSAFAEILGTTSRHGVTYGIVGAVLLAAGFLAPTVYRDQRVTTEVR